MILMELHENQKCDKQTERRMNERVYMGIPMPLVSPWAKYHGGWCLGSLCRQAIGSHDINCRTHTATRDDENLAPQGGRENNAQLTHTEVQRTRFHQDDV